MIDDLFADDAGINLINTDGVATYWPSLLSIAQADELFNELLQHSHWQQERIELYGQSHDQPRLTCWYGCHGVSASSGYQSHTPAKPFSPRLQSLKKRIESLTDCRFNSVLANLYRDGQDSVGYHADDEAILGRNPAIASYSLGATRRFLLRHSQAKADSLRIDLPHNSLLLMTGELQHHWQHAIGKTRRSVEPRINLTFRQLQSKPSLF